jgi:hypothetical protein
MVELIDAMSCISSLVSSWARLHCNFQVERVGLAVTIMVIVHAKHHACAGVGLTWKGTDAVGALLISHALAASANQPLVA